MSIVTKVEPRTVEFADLNFACASAAMSRRGVTSRYFHWKEPLERLLSLLLLAPGGLIVALLVIVVRCTSRGPGIFRQTRVGKGGKPFVMYKIRTMRSDAERAGAQWSHGAGDPRVTGVGRFIRKLHLDEFPQLWNVVRGEMSLIGPRPERPEFVEVLSRAIPDYALRHRVRPGITGLAQINLPPDTDLDSVRRKLVLDLEYMQSANPLLDLRMFMCTVLRMVGIRGGLAMTMMRLQRSVSLAQPLTPSGVGESTRVLTPQSVAHMARGTALPCDSRDAGFGEDENSDSAESLLAAGRGNGKPR